MEEYLLNNKSKYDPILYEAFINLYKRCKYNPRILSKTFNNEHCSHYYGKYAVKDWLENKNPHLYGEIEVPIFTGAIKTNIVKKLGFNPSNSDVSVLMGKNLIARCDLVMYDRETDEPVLWVEIVNTSPCSMEKIEKLNNLGITGLYEISVDYIMKNKKINCPKDLMENMKVIL